MDGVLLIDKPAGCTSHDVCQQVKRKLAARKVGHTGTLDPMATGVLPLCIDGATKLAQFLMCGEKEYEGVMRFGIETDTQDLEGAVLGTSDDVPADRAAVEEAFAAFRGEILQTPPMYSAVKRRGVPLYRLARQGKVVDRDPRRVAIAELEVLGYEPPDSAFRVVCSQGTYVRTLCHDIGRRLSCGAVLASLARVRNGNFHLRDALSLEELDGLTRDDICRRHLIPLRDALCGLPGVVVTDAMARKLRNGVSVTAADVRGLDMPAHEQGQYLKVCTPGGGLVGVVQALAAAGAPMIADRNAPAWKTVRVFAA